MWQWKLTETQIVSILKEADAVRPVNEIWRSNSISSTTYYFIARHSFLSRHG